MIAQSEAGYRILRCTFTCSFVLTDVTVHHRSPSCIIVVIPPPQPRKLRLRSPFIYNITQLPFLFLSYFLIISKMRFLHLAALLPLAIGAPTKDTTPELSVSEWSSIQSGFIDNVRSLGSWSWSAAQDVIEEFENVNDGETGEDRTIWQQLLADPHSFSKIVKLIEVCRTLLL